MLTATEEERQLVESCIASQVSDESIEFLQKVYSEKLNTVKHDIWDVHTDKHRWWAITQPMNLYSQEQMPNMDISSYDAHWSLRETAREGSS